MFLPDEILTKEDLRIVASIMKREDISIPLKGYKLKHGKRHEATYVYARANAAGDDILLESSNVVEPRMMPLWDIYPQLVSYLKERKMYA